MSVRVVSYEAAVKQALGVKLASNLGDAAALLKAEIQAAIGVQGPPRSHPGEYPHRDTGALQESIEDQLDADNLVARVSSDMPYAGTLEVSMDRAYFVPVLLEQSDALARIICRP
jgi:hypothetical protein